MDKGVETESKSDADNPGSAKPDTDNSGSAKPDTDNSDTECNACANTVADRTTDTETDGSTGRGRE